MKRKHLDFEVWEKEALKDPKFKAEYDRLQPEFAVINAIIDSQKKKGYHARCFGKKNWYQTICYLKA